VSIVGRLEDVPVVDVLSMLHLSGRSGELSLQGTAAHARIVFRSGAIVAASCPSLGRSLGTVLKERLGLSPDIIEQGLLLQRESKRPLGRILIEQNLITRVALHEAVTRLIREVVAHVLGFRAGSFRFEVQTTPAEDEVAVVPDEVALETGLAVKELVSGALRLFDRPLGPEGAAHERGVVLVSFKELGMQTHICALEQDTARQVAELLGTGSDVITVLHVEGMGARGDARNVVSTARRLKAAFPPVPLVIAGGLENGARTELLRHGVRAVVPLSARGKDPRAFRAQLAEAASELSATLQGAFVELSGSGSFVDGASHDVKRLAARVEGLHRSTEHTTVALALLGYVAENVERAVLFLVRREDVIAISAFGRTLSGEDMVDVVPGLSVRLDEMPALEALVEEGQARRGSSSGELDCPALLGRIGRPRAGTILWIPVRSVDRVFAVLYADNGARMRPLVSSEALQVLACQAGLMLENMALRRRG
jgi:hypothetical protein